VVLDEDTLKMDNGSSLLFADEDKCQITAFLRFYLRGLMQREALI
jgi:hypothetical protein